MVSPLSCFSMFVVLLCSDYHTVSEALPAARAFRKSALATKVSQKLKLLPEQHQFVRNVFDQRSSKSDRHSIAMKVITHAGRINSADRSPPVHGPRQKRYLLIGEAWNKRELTYQVTQYTPDLPRIVVDTTIDEACKMWEAVSPIKFTRIFQGKPDIELMFVEGHHGDAEAFYGEGGRLAHAEGPMYGDIHFDDDETWTLGEDRGTNLLYVAVHELGHSLGLDHSDLKTAVMHHTYPGYKRVFNLHADDIEGIQQVYPDDTAGSGEIELPGSGEIELPDVFPKDSAIYASSDEV